MPSQNINNYGSNKFDLRIDYTNYYDITIGNDENDFDDEVVFGVNLIGQDDGDRLPIHIDLNSFACSNKSDILWNDNQLIPYISRSYLKLDKDNDCYTSSTLCNIGLTGVDNGLVDKITGQTLYFTMGLDESNEISPLHYTRKFKFNNVRSFANFPNSRFSGNTNTVYNLVSKTQDKVGYYNELYGGFYQGFYKLSGYDFEVFPERVKKGWTVETVIKPRQREEFNLGVDEVYLNDLYPENSGTFFYMGTRSENKFYHTSSGETSSGSTVSCDGEIIYFSTGLTGFSKDTRFLNDDFKTCACADTGVTNSDCIRIYPSTGGTKSITNDFDPGLDLYSNGLAVRLEGDPVNPKVCVKYITITGDCINGGKCEDDINYKTGYCINEICSTAGIYDSCNLIKDNCNQANTEEKWVMMSIVFERKDYIENCDLLNFGGLGSVRKKLYQSQIEDNYSNLIQPPQTHSGETHENKKIVTSLNSKWLSEKNERIGSLKIYVNGYLLITIENFEEIIPRELRTEKEKQIGVPFNISWGGGTQGLRESIIPFNTETVNGPYIQDKLCMTNNTLSGTSYSSVTTNILSESTFGGSFMGAISQFRMYTEPLTAPQIQHNFRVLKDRYDLYDFWCLECLECLTDCFFDYETSQDIYDFDFVINKASCVFDVEIYNL
jgi:hypothetical protein